MRLTNVLLTFMLLGAKFMLTGLVGWWLGEGKWHPGPRGFWQPPKGVKASVASKAHRAQVLKRRDPKGPGVSSI